MIGIRLRRFLILLNKKSRIDKIYYTERTSYGAMLKLTTFELKYLCMRQKIMETLDLLEEFLNENRQNYLLVKNCCNCYYPIERSQK